MTTLLLSLGACLLLLAIVLIIIWRRTDWRRIDTYDRDFLDAEGDHVYYDRHYIASKKKK